MTETDRVYVAMTETMKKYNVEQAIAALKKYITEGNANYFTSTNNARKTICELSPVQVMKDALISNIKYEQIIREKGYAQVLPNYSVVEQAITSYQTGDFITTQLSSSDLSELIIRMVNSNVPDAVNMLAQNPAIFDSFLAQYSVIVCNHRNDLNKIPNENFTNINEYFLQFEQQSEMQR